MGFNGERVMKEEWRPVIGFEGLYEISSFGRVRSLPHIDSCGRLQGGIILSVKNSKGWYLTSRLTNGCIRESRRIHRMVYEAFRGEIPKGFQIHHIDGNRQNNRVDNLSLVDPVSHSKEHYVNRLIESGIDISTPQDQLKYIVKDGIIIGENPNYNNDSHYGAIAPKNKDGKYVTAKHRRIAQYELDGTFIAEYETARDAYFETGVCARNILQVANKTPYNDKGFTRKQAGGYIWKFAD